MSTPANCVLGKNHCTCIEGTRSCTLAKQKREIFTEFIEHMLTPPDKLPDKDLLLIVREIHAQQNAAFGFAASCPYFLELFKRFETYMRVQSLYARLEQRIKPVPNYPKGGVVVDGPELIITNNSAHSFTEGSELQEVQPCTTCNGSGNIHGSLGFTRCSTCEGKGILMPSDLNDNDEDIRI